MIAADRIVVFSKTFCPYCAMAKRLLEHHKQTYKTYELDELPNGSSIQQHLETLTSQRTVPSIFIKSKHIGGCDDLF